MCRKNKFKAFIAAWSFAWLLTAASTVFAAPVTVKHHMGEMTLAKTPKRVVVLGHASLDLLDKLGIEPVGVVKTLLPDYLKKYQDEKYTAAGSNLEPDFEAIYMLKPDLIIAESRVMPVYDKLAAIAPTYMFYIENGQYWQDTQQNWLNLGKIFNKNEVIKPLIADLDKQIATVHAKAEKSGQSALTVMNNGSNLASFGADSRFSHIYHEFGLKPSVARNIKAKAGKHGNLISFEYIADAQPDVLFVLDREQAIGRSTGRAQTLFSNPLVASTPAYKNKRLIFINSAAWYLTAGGVTATRIMLDDVSQALN